ncbi:hypothetical protein PGT21_005749 [Puccinia graminis f. sp. tritici]|uniref:Uncharacterized protein n=1 Tax=Puccinia graminis f. sp. tritici TaxID=56615 RepID=A0A5B0N7X0_PUCGR|nr:hypothetical protein PGT21_005749 [Puccinia graminis f. sp. tritici]KAA1129944.1 hypothetical protein PGTUg99_008938 [Puccinia graminis f. sp. tritici]
MQSFNLFIVFAVLLINTQFYGANAFGCPNPGAPGNRKFAYCTRTITAAEHKADPSLKDFTMFKEFLKLGDDYTCSKKVLKGKPAEFSYCCDVEGQVGQVLGSPESMWTNKCSQVTK